MAYQFEQIASLDQVDFDGLFAASFPDIDNNFLWMDELATDELKKDFYLNQLRTALDGNSSLSREPESERFLMYKITNDGVDYLLAAGFVEPGGCFRGHWYLTRPNSGSRSWIYDADTAAARVAFFESVGVYSYKALTHASAALYTSLRNNAARNNLQILDQQTILSHPQLPEDVVAITVQL